MFAPRLLAVMTLLTAISLLTLTPETATGQKGNQPGKVNPIPPVGIDLPPADLDEIKKGLAELQADIKAIGNHPLLPDVEVYEKAVRWALDYKEVFDAKGIPAVKNVLKTGLERAKAMRAGQTPWTTQTGLVVRGYRSKIDGSVQPYGLVVPKEYDFAGANRHRLDFWWHGRGETLSEANFIDQRQRSPGEFTPAGALVLHPYGRYCNANKFAGEIDTLECLEHAKKHYRIDESRIVARGFSMGGAACWQFAVHYPTLWCAAAPGAGFAETPEFLNVFQNEKVEPTWYEKKLWRLYNATDYAQNIFNLPTVAYSGEIDRQKQAADVMAREMKKVGLELTHVIGPKTGHSYEKGAKAEINEKIDAIVAKGKDWQPKEIKFVTYTTRYNRCGWVTVDQVERHWQRAAITGKRDGGNYEIKTSGITAFTLTIPPGAVNVEVDGRHTFNLAVSGVIGTEPWVYRFRKVDGKWQCTSKVTDGREDPTPGMVKKPGLQGPIDDAFMDKFLMVAPTGKPLAEKTGAWAEAEMKHAVSHWRSQFRGDAPVKKDTEITDADIKNNNLILWGDATSNKILGRIANQLPVKWVTKKVRDGYQEIEQTSVVLGDKEYPAETHMPVLIFPNPLNPAKYVVLNSGFTFREYDYLNNARQVPKLPDYAVVDVTTPPNARYPGKIVRAGFFGEKWELLPDDGK